jgi:hypothetical protein
LFVVQWIVGIDGKAKEETKFRPMTAEERKPPVVLEVPENTTVENILHRLGCPQVSFSAHLALVQEILHPRAVYDVCDPILQRIIVNLLDETPPLLAI